MDAVKKSRPRKAYGQVNVALFQKIKKKILAEPESFDMGVFGKSKATTRCGTAACIAGWTNAFEHLKKYKTLRTCDFDNTEKAASLLGLRDDPTTFDCPSGWVFFTDEWPLKFQRKMEKAEGSDPKVRSRECAKVAAEYIDWICEK